MTQPTRQELENHLSTVPFWKVESCILFPGAGLLPKHFKNKRCREVYESALESYKNHKDVTAEFANETLSVPVDDIKINGASGLSESEWRTQVAELIELASNDPDSFEKYAYSMSEELSMEFPKQELILGEWLFTDSMNMVHGGTGIGKTWMMLGVALTLATGETFIPGWKLNVSPMKVLLVDGEMSPDDLRERKVELAKGVGISTSIDNLVTLSSVHTVAKGGHMIDLSQKNQRERLTKYILDNEFKFVSLDNLSCLIPGINIKESQDYSPFNTWLIEMRAHGVMMQIVHHDNKKEDFTGANEITFQLQSRLHIKKDGAGFKIVQSKSRSLKGGDVSLEVMSGEKEGLILVRKSNKRSALESAVVFLQNNDFSKRDKIDAYLLKSGHTENAIQKMFLGQKGNRSGKRIFIDKGKYYLQDE